MEYVEKNIDKLSIKQKEHLGFRNIDNLTLKHKDHPDVRNIDKLTLEQNNNPTIKSKITKDLYKLSLKQRQQLGIIYLS